jgi:hypothetical protein
MLSSKSKKDRRPDPDVSVDPARLTTPRRSLWVANRPTQGIASIQAGFPRSLGLEVVHSPTAENEAHSSIRGNEGEDALDTCDLLADEMTKTILIYPQGAAVRAGWISPPDSALGE